jgi:hypothetical protein
MSQHDPATPLTLCWLATCANAYSQDGAVGSLSSFSYSLLFFINLITFNGPVSLPMENQNAAPPSSCRPFRS